MTAASSSYNESLLVQQRRRALEMEANGLPYSSIGAAIGISAIKARDLCEQHRRFLAFPPPHPYMLELSQRAILCLISGKHAGLAGDFEGRLASLIDIAACYTRAELLLEESVGKKTCNEIEIWLASKGRSFLASVESPSSTRRVNGTQS